ncbi:MAG: putative bifunctional diguanylate cyclase/phosphodiesterase [Candidatus Dormibacteria bacterium]
MATGWRRLWGSLGPPSATFDRVRWSLLVIALSGLIAAVPLVLVASDAGPVLRWSGVAGLVWLAWWWVHSYRKDAFGWQGDAACLAAIFVVVVGASDPANSQMVLLTGLAFRAISARPTAAYLMAGGFLVVALAGDLAIRLDGRLASATGDLVALLLALLLLVVVVQILRGALARQRESLARDNIVRSAGTEFLSASMHAQIFESVRSAIHLLIAEASRVGATLVAIDGSTLRIFGGTEGEHGAGVELELGAIPPVLRDALLTHSPAAQDRLLRQAATQYLGVSAAWPHMTLWRLTAAGQAVGALVISTETPIVEPLAGALQALSNECSLAVARVALARRIERSEAKFKALVQNSSDIVVSVAANGLIGYASPSTRALLGNAVPESSRSRMDELIDEADHPVWVAALRDVLADPNQNRKAEFRLRHDDGTVSYVEAILVNLLGDADVAAIVVTARDITERRQLEDQLRHQALHDPLTTLANRVLLRDRIEHALATSERRRPRLALVALDLDDFKHVNDTYGHPTGDAVLVEVARRVSACLRPADTFARLGGDEFAILLEGAGSALARQVSDRIAAALRPPVRLAGDVVVTIGTSMGIATAQQAKVDPDTMLRNADIALYRAKADGKGGAVMYRSVLHDQVVRRMETETGLRRALDAGELVLFYQPIWTGTTHRMVGVEALIRWQLPDGKLVFPDDFIPVAESTGLIIPMGRWVLMEACRQARSWDRDDAELADLQMSVNVSPRQLRHAGLVADVKAALDSAGLDPHRLVLEITETAVAGDLDGASKQLAALRSLGVKVAIDDFGTGQSALGLLHQLPLDELKIDRCFIARMADSQDGRALVQSIIDVAEALHLEIVAEGVETAEQASLVAGMSSAPLLQGFLFSRALSPKDLESLACGTTLPEDDRVASAETDLVVGVSS